MKTETEKLTQVLINNFNADQQDAKRFVQANIPKARRLAKKKKMNTQVALCLLFEKTAHTAG